VLELASVTSEDVATGGAILRTRCRDGGTSGKRLNTDAICAGVEDGLVACWGWLRSSYNGECGAKIEAWSREPD